MKRVLMLLFAGSFIALFTSCGPQQTNQQEESMEDTTTMEAPMEEEIAPMEEDTTSMEGDTTMVE